MTIVPHIPHAPIKKPLWQRARKDFIRLVDEDKIPETHKRLNHHYLRRLPYYAISTEPPIIVEAPEPEPEPEPDVMLFPAGQSFSWVRVVNLGPISIPGVYSGEISKPFYRSDGKRLFGDLSDDELKAKFTEWVKSNTW